MLDVSAFKPLVMGVDEGVSLGAGVLLGALFGRSGRARAPAPPAPPPLDTGRAPADLAGALGALHHEQLVPLVDRQMRALFVAAALDGWLARDGAEMPPRVSRPDEGDGWWRSEREAELAMPRQIERALSTATCAPVDGPVAPRSGGLLARWIAWARDRQLTEREALNAEINAVNHRARQHALALDDGLAEVVPGWVAGDVFYCTPGELISLVAEPTGSPIADERASRRRRHEADEAAVVPTRCELDGAGDPIGPPPGGALGGGVATGVALGEGSVVGPACHARDGADLDIAAARGAILLVAGPSPAWGRHVLVAAGVVLVGSGPLSHLALLARERGVPALTAVSGDLSEIQDGDPLVLDLRAGHLDRAD
jgi:phosphohistidine swiveling domain-containing protein/xanthosine utilization system XapX-like protein